MSAAAHVLTIFLSFLPSTGGMDGMTDPANFGKAWECPYAASAENCQAGIVKALDAIFVDFEVRFTTVRPSGDDFRTVFLTNDTPASWHLADNIAGITMSKTCEAKQDSKAVIFDCPSTLMCAKHVAHEVGHMLGLVHVDDPRDLMWPTDNGAARFWDVKVSTFGDDPRKCHRKTQNSYEYLMKRIGPRGSGLQAVRTMHKKGRRR